MVLTKRNIQTHLIMLLALLSWGCTEEDFFQKEFLPGVGVPNPEKEESPGSTPPPTPAFCNGGTIVDSGDSFIQNTAQQADVDILWVIDDSGSMGDEQDELANNFEAFIQDFLLQGIDFTMAVTTTDATAAKDGEMVGDPSLLTATAAAQNEALFIQNFQNTVLVGTDGSGSEQGLHTTASFLTKNAASFLREQAYLILVYVSDEEDQSPHSVSTYLDTYKSYKNNPGLVKAFSIITTELTDKPWETIGHRYIEAANSTGGTHSSIHQDFHNTLLDMGASILDLLDSFALSGNPIEQSLTVKVNNVPATMGWSYNPASKTLKFETGHIPPEGSSVNIQYQECIGGV